jgi:vitamin B12 transporter
LLNVDQIDSIEILKGASSTLYGSGAATAVINIKLKEASGTIVSAHFKSVLATNQSSTENNNAIEDFRNSVSVSGTLNKLTYLASFGNQYTDGLSSISNGTESDAFNTINGNLKLGYQFSNAFKLNVYGSFDKYKADFDDAFSGMDTDDVSISKQNRVGLSSELNYASGSLTVNAAYNTIDREIQSGYPTKFNADSYVADVFNRYNFDNKFYTIIGINAQDNKMESFSIPYGGTSFEQSINPEDAKFTIIDPYANVVYASNFGLQVNAGLRFNNHSEYGSHVVYSINPSFKKDTGFGYLKGLASYSTAYIIPSLYQLFEPTYGNADLKPEENATVEIGAEISLKDKAMLSLVYFSRNEKNFIDFVDLGGFVFQYNNVEESFNTSGVEFTANYKITESILLKANATYTKVEDDLNLRIPEFKANARLDYKVSDHTFLSLSYQFNDERRDSVFNNTTFMNDDIVMDSYSLLDFYVSHYIIKSKLKLFANVTNLFNADYVELFGYSTKGRNASIGFNLSL